MSRLTKNLKLQFRKLQYRLSSKTIDSDVFDGTFLETKSFQTQELLPASPLIYCFWTGENEMSDNRKRNLETLYTKADVEIQLVTAKNLHKYVLPNVPLHDCYPNLSDVHKSDYLRCYFMHHLGGGYHDIKACENSWKTCFQKLNQSENKWIAGFTELKPQHVASVGGRLQNTLEQHFLQLIGTSAFICKPNSPFTTIWWHQLNEVLDNKQMALLQNPGNILGDNVGYPLQWTEILGNIFHPNILYFRSHVLHDENLRPSFANYR